MITLLDPTYNWKQAASQEAVDYDAVQKSFMDQAYGVVANKAKILFQDPFRLGFEIVNRNEKATKMVGIFAFRVNKELLYAPVFFVNGEIKSADMLYRTSVKRFVPLTEKWCAHLVRGVSEAAGSMVSKNRVKQPDAYMNRLAYPQHTKYASDIPTDLVGGMITWLELATTKPDPESWLRKQAAVEQHSEVMTALAEFVKLAGSPSFGRSLGVGVAGGLGGAVVGGIPLVLLANKLSEMYESRGGTINPKVKEWIDRGLLLGSAAGGSVLARNLDAQSDPSRWDAEGKKLPKVEESEEEVDQLKEALHKAATDGSIFRELLVHCADKSPMRKLIPQFVSQDGPEALEKLAKIAESGTYTERCVAEYYTQEELTSAPAWIAKSAAVKDPEEGCIVLVTSPAQVKSAAERGRLFDYGYSLIDKRPASAHNAIVEEVVSDGTIAALSTPGEAHILLDNGELLKGLLLTEDYSMLQHPADITSESRTKSPTCVYIPEKKELLEWRPDGVFGDSMPMGSGANTGCKAVDVKDGVCYAMIDPKRFAVSPVFLVKGKRKVDDATVLTVVKQYGSECEIVYAPDREREEGSYVSDNVRFVEVACDVDRRDNAPGISDVWNIQPQRKCVLMTSSGIDKWIRTAGNITTSHDITVRPKTDGVFDITHRSNGQVVKSARDLGRLEAHLMLAEDFCLTVDKAGELLDKSAGGERRYRVYDSLTKKGFTTRVNGMENWVEGFDPSLQVRLDAPQRQVISTYTPERPSQEGRYGDVYNRGQGGLDGRNSDTTPDLIPSADIFQKSPEELAYLSQKYDMPHIFDHGCLGRMATSGFSMAEQVKQYIPDLEAGLDRLYRILFLIRYRPAEFEDAYGKDSMLEMEQELSDLAGKTGDTLLRLLQRFDVDQYSAQEN